MKTQLRIVGGSLRGRKLTFFVDPSLRPMPDRVRQALFNILADAVPDRPFYDLFAGTGAVGFEALSRGASEVVFVERDIRTAGQIMRHAHEFDVTSRVHIHRADVYRWVETGVAPIGPTTVFVGPPYPDFEHRPADLLRVFERLQASVSGGSVLVAQTEKEFDVGVYPHAAGWEHRIYGRTRLSFWTRSGAEALGSPR